MGGGVGVVSTGEVTIIRGDNSVFVSFLDVLSVPLTDAGSAGVGKDRASEFVEGFGLNKSRKNIN